MKQVIILVRDEHWSDFQKYYLKRRPVPLDEEQPIMSVGDWIKKCILDDIYQTLKEGKQMEAFNELEIDIEIT